MHPVSVGSRISDMDTSHAAERARDLELVMQLWRKLGHSPSSIRGYRHYVRNILERANGSDYAELCADRVVRLALSYARQHHTDPQDTRRLWLSAFRAFAWGLQRLGKAVGSIELSKRSSTQAAPVLVDFVRHGEQLGWAEQTLRLHLRYLAELHRFLVRHHAPWPVPRLRDLDRFLQHVATRWQRATVSGAAGTCRTWLRFLFITGRSEHDLASSVSLPPRILYPRPPRALPWATVRQLHRGIDPTTPIGRRDDAQYHLFCAYGLSSAEITHLKLEDIDWAAGILHIRRRKNGSTVDLPLLPAVAKSIAGYLQHARPQSACRHVFIRHTIPFGPLSHGTIGERVRCWAERAHVQTPFIGAHVFRHSFATCQLERGAPLKVIADILGHRDCRTTAIYVRAALARLRPLALPVPV